MVRERGWWWPNCASVDVLACFCPASFPDPHSNMATPAERWLEANDDDLTASLVDELLSLIFDDLWVAAACVDRVVDDVDVQRHVLHVGLKRTGGAAKEVQKVLEVSGTQGDDEDREGERGTPSSELQFDDSARELVALRRLLLSRSDLVETYVAMAEAEGWKLPGQAEDVREPEKVEEDLDDLDLDPWAEAEEGPEPETTSRQVSPQGTVPPPLSLSAFIFQPLPDTALLLATIQQLAALDVLFTRHASPLFPHRHDILAAIPLHVPADFISSILPAFDYVTSMEKPPSSQTPRSPPDWAATDEAARFLHSAPLNVSIPLDALPSSEPVHRLSAEELSAWYGARVTSIDAALGLVDVALTYVQHGASQGIPGLDALGEELSLLSRLVYDTGSSDSSNVDTKWNLQRWRSMDTSAVVSSYLSLSTPETIASDIRKLVLPYLYVLEARQERAGTPDPTIPTRYLYDYILTAPLPIVAAIFDASKPTLPQSQRLLKKNEDMARLALACLYGSDSLDEWDTMSKIFECLPEWQSGGAEDDVEGDAADTTLRSMASFVAPSATRPRATPQELLLFFNPLPQRSLSRALDILDVHLESGEILSRWDVPAPLRWFLQSANDEGQQRARATRMARRNTDGDEIENQQEWVSLLKDMIRLAGGKEGLMRGAFGLLSKDQVKRIFFEGILSLGSESMDYPETTTR